MNVSWPTSSASAQSPSIPITVLATRGSKRWTSSLKASSSPSRAALTSSSSVKPGPFLTQRDSPSFFYTLRQYNIKAYSPQPGLFMNLVPRCRRCLLWQGGRPRQGEEGALRRRSRRLVDNPGYKRVMPKPRVRFRHVGAGTTHRLAFGRLAAFPAPSGVASGRGPCSRPDAEGT
jgi:hypothetical protein